MKLIKQEDLKDGDYIFAFNPHTLVYYGKHISRPRTSRDHSIETLGHAERHESYDGGYTWGVLDENWYLDKGEFIYLLDKDEVLVLILIDQL